MKYITTGQAARICGVGVNTIKRWIQNGALKAIVTPGGHWRIPESDFNRLLETHGMQHPRQPDNTAYKILLVDDDSAMCDFMTGALDTASFQYEGEYAHDGYSGLIKVGSMQPDLLILDIMLPEINGLEIIHRLRANPDLSPLPKILAITGAGDRRIVRKGLERANPDAVLFKPLGIEQFVSTVTQLLCGDKQADNQLFENS